MIHYLIQLATLFNSSVIIHHLSPSILFVFMIIVLNFLMVLKMLNFRILNSKDREELFSSLNDTYGIKESDVSGLLTMGGKDKVRLLSKDITPEVLNLLNKNLRLEFLGLYICKLEKDGVRLSHDAANLFKDVITKSIFLADDRQSKEWLMGHEVLLTDEQIKSYENMKGFFVLKNSNDMIIGCGKLSNNRITNFVPKSRRLKK